MTFLYAIVVSAVLLWSIPSYASVTLPFSTTHNCAEQDQNSGGWVTCDGLAAGGGWTTSLGAVEQITTAANYPSGGGGRGQRHWHGNGTNNTSGSISYTITNPSTELWARWHYRYQSGTAMASSGGSHKVIYFRGAGCNGNSGGCYFLFDGQTALRITVAGTNFGNGGTYGWNDLMGGVNSADGLWHCNEVHVKVVGAGTSIAQWWIDGVLRLDQSSVNFGGTGVGFDSFFLPENAVLTTPGGADMFEDIDDVALQTTGPIGCLAGATSARFDGSAHLSGGVRIQ
jgi:hypothetical protein